jgi:hypothetical protein
MDVSMDDEGEFNKDHEGILGPQNSQEAIVSACTIFSLAVDIGKARGNFRH